MIGLKRGTVQLVPYDSDWGQLFLSEKKNLIKVFNDHIVDIQHVGSTAIPTIPAKPIIDIAVLVKSLNKIDKCIAGLELLGYRKKEEDRTDRQFFTKGSEENRIVYLHVGDESNEYIKDMIVFRDYLAQNLTEAEKYAELKKELAGKFANSRKFYTAAKENFVQEVLRKVKKVRG